MNRIYLRFNLPLRGFTSSWTGGLHSANRVMQPIGLLSINRLVMRPTRYSNQPHLRK